MGAPIGEGPHLTGETDDDDPLVEQCDLLRAVAELTGVEDRMPIAAQRAVEALLTADGPVDHGQILCRHG